MKYESRRFVQVLSVMLVGGLAGLGSALLAVQLVSRVESGAVGPWQVARAANAGDAGPWMRTAEALSGQYVLRSDAALYFTAFRDSGGERLSDACVYYVTGRMPEAERWSLTVYGRDHFLIPDAAGPWSVSSRSAPDDARGRTQVKVGGDDDGGGWIATRGGGDGLSLTLRLHGPAPGLAADPASATLPAIDRADCE